MSDQHDILKPDHTALPDRDVVLCVYDLSKAQIRTCCATDVARSAENLTVHLLKTTPNPLQNIQCRGSKATNSPYLPHRATGFVQQDFNRCCH